MRMGSSTIAQLRLEPGWHWATDVKPIAGTGTCQVRHAGYMISGRSKVTMADGSSKEIVAGDTYLIEPGHDAVVADTEPVVALEFSTTAAEIYAKQH